MKKNFFLFVIAAAGILILAGIVVVVVGLIPVNRTQSVPQASPAAIIETGTADQVVTENSDIPVVNATLSFEAATYKDETARIELSYPMVWGVEPNQQIGDRGSQAALLSPGSTLEQIADGGTRIILTAYKWDPKNDLTAFVAQRKQAWEASGFKLLKEGLFTLEDGRQVEIFNVVTSDGTEVIFAFVLSGQDYLQIAGEGNLDLALEIIKTIRSVQ